MIEFTKVNKTYPENIVALNDINLAIEEKEFAFITGPSGAGKSTLVRLLIREEKPTLGDIFFEEIDVVNLSNRLLPLYRQQIGMTFQDLKLIESRTARENIEFALEIINKKSSEILETAEYLLDLVGLQDRSELLPCQLSGGEKQKIAIARALASEPKILIADEPTGNLDPQSTEEIMDILKTINSIDTTVLVITHDYDVVNKMNTRVITMEKGRIVSDKKGKYLLKVQQKNEEEVKEKEVKEEKKTKSKTKKKKEVKEEKKEEKNDIELLELPKKTEKKLLENDVDSLDKLLDLTESKLLKMGITKKELEAISEIIMELNNLEEE